MIVITANGRRGIQPLPNGTTACHNLLYRPGWSIQPSPAQSPGNQTVCTCEMHCTPPHTHTHTRAQKQQEKDQEKEEEEEGGRGGEG